MTSSISSNVPALSFGSIKRILDDEALESVVLQILGYKKIPGMGIDRFRLLLSDGVTAFPYAVLATQLNHMIETKRLEKYTVLKLNKYACSKVDEEKKVIIILDVEVIVPGSQVKDKISENKLSTNSCQPSTSRQSAQSPSTSNTGLSNKSLNAFSLKQNRIVAQSDPKPINNQDYNVGKCNSVEVITQSDDIPVFPIISLTPYQNKWTIKARVVYKTPPRNYSNQRGEGIFFSFYLLDETGEIKATAFNESAERLHSLLVLDKVYYLANADVKPSRDNVSTKFDYEIIISPNTRVEEFVGNTSNIPRMQFNFTPISQIAQCGENSVDVIGMCNSVSEIRPLVTKKNNTVSKRDLQLFDMSCASVILSLWGSEAETFPLSNNCVVAIRNANVTNFHNCSLSTSSRSMVFLNPNIKEAYKLKSWFESMQGTVELKSISSHSFDQYGSQTWKTFDEVSSDNCSALDKPNYFTNKATVVLVEKEKCLYQACPSVDCYKKVVDSSNGLYRCDKCNQNYETFNWTYLLSVNLADFSNSHWATAFREIAELMVGHQPEELSQIKEADEDRYYNILSSMHFKSFVFKLRSKVETYNEISRLKSTIMDVKPVDFNSYTKKLLVDVKRMEKILNST